MALSDDQATRQLSADDAFGNNASQDEIGEEFEFTLADAEDDRQIPKTLGEYEIIEPIGAGGMGQVFKARHQMMDRMVAIKVLPIQFSSRADLVERFNAEIRATAKLMHPNIVTAFDAGRSGDLHYLVMELVHGSPLTAFGGENGKFTTVQAIDLLAQVATALQHAHSHELVHRDIKPGNMLRTDQGLIKVLDFGLASIRNAVMQSTTKKQIIGTVEFMSPEQISTPDQVDHRSDLYSLGATVYYLMTGRYLFSGDPVEIALAHLKKQPPALHEVLSDVDLRLDGIVQKLVSKRADQRFQTAQELLKHMSQLDMLTEIQNEDTAVVKSIREAMEKTNPLTVGMNEHSTSQASFAAIGIDLGMATSRACFMDEKHQLHEIAVDASQPLIRHVLWSHEGDIKIGGEATKLRASHPDQVFFGIQRWFGREVVDRDFGGRKVPPEVLLGSVLRKIADNARISQRNTSHAVVTVPACYDQLHRVAVKTAVRIAGLEVLQLLDKPLAAALAFAEMQSHLLLDNSEMNSGPTLVMVASLAGTGCEASLVEIDGLCVRHVATVGDWKMGKIRWQNTLAEHFAARFEKEHGLKVKKKVQAASRVQRTAEMAIDRLIAFSSVSMNLEAGGKSIEAKLSREDLLKIVGPLAMQVREFTRECLESASVTPDAVKHILFTGDMMGMPQMQSIVKRCFPRNVPSQWLEQSELARGAAMQARAILPPGDETLPFAEMTSCYPIALLTESDGRVSKQPIDLLAAGAALPAVVSRKLRFDKVVPSKIHLLEAVQATSKKWHRLSQLDLQQAFPNRKHSDFLQLRAELDRNGILSGQLAWLEANVTLPMHPTERPPMDEKTIHRWADWLETTMMTSG